MSVSTIYSYMGATVVYRHKFCTPSLDGKSMVSFTSWLLCLGKSTTGSCWIGDRVGPRPSMAILKKAQISYPTSSQAMDHPAHSSVTILTVCCISSRRHCKGHLICDTLVGKLTDCQVAEGSVWIPRFIPCIRSLKITKCAFLCIYIYIY